MAPKPDLSVGAWRLAWRETSHYLGTFWIGGALMGLLAGMVGSVIATPEHSTLPGLLLLGTIAAALTIALLVGLVFVVCLIRAPFRRRKDLRNLAKSGGTLAPLDD